METARKGHEQALFFIATAACVSKTFIQPHFFQAITFLNAEKTHLDTVPTLDYAMETVSSIAHLFDGLLVLANDRPVIETLLERTNLESLFRKCQRLLKQSRLALPAPARHLAAQTSVYAECMAARCAMGMMHPQFLRNELMGLWRQLDNLLQALELRQTVKTRSYRDIFTGEITFHHFNRGGSTGLYGGRVGEKPRGMSNTRENGPDETFEVAVAEG